MKNQFGLHILLIFNQVKKKKDISCWWQDLLWKKSPNFSVSKNKRNFN